MSEENNSLQIYLSPISIILPKSNQNNTSFQSKHSLEFPQESINYIYNSIIINQNNQRLPEWKVLNPYFNIVNNSENYVLNNFHMHYPAEHTINNVRYPLEIHFVFMDLEETENALVLGYIFKIGERSSSIVKSILDNTPLKLPFLLDKDFCTYNGSLTKTNLEDIEPLAVNWNLVTKLKTITNEDLQTLIRTNVTRDASILRPSNGRNVIFVNKCCGE